MKLLFILILISICAVNCAPPNEAENDSVNDDTINVELVEWLAEDCDNTYNPYMLLNRITSFESNNGITSITVNFADNCCAEFEPNIAFKNNTLALLPYGDSMMSGCDCNCCFSITYKIKGCPVEDYDIYFKGAKIEISGDHYKTFEFQDTLYEGERINRKNKYGFREGLWITFYGNGKKETMRQYPESSQYNSPKSEWSKEFYESGKLKRYERSDTSESWFEDGTLQSEYIKYKSGDTTYEKGFDHYDNGQLAERYLEQKYPTIHTSDLDPTYNRTGSTWKYLYKEEYFNNGQQKYLQGKDTNKTWFENGQVKFLSYTLGSIEFNENGQLIVKSYHWKKKGMPGEGDLNFSVYAEYYENGTVKQIHFVRDEIYNGGSSTTKKHYYWKWDKKKQLTKSPENWNEPYPWDNIDEVKFALKGYKLD
jgi:hypothetical protein